MTPAELWTRFLDWLFDRCWELGERFGPAVFAYLTANEAA